MKIDRTQVQPLYGWYSVPEAAEEMGMSRQALHNRIARGLVPFEALRSVGSVLVVSSKWVDAQD